MGWRALNTVVRWRVVAGIVLLALLAGVLLPSQWDYGPRHIAALLSGALVVACALVVLGRTVVLLIRTSKRDR
jgi:hypothetical protein